MADTLVTPFQAQPLWHDGIPHETHWQKLFGVFLIIVLVAGFGFWAATAPIAGAVVTSGTFVATGKNKIVQHLEGGMIKDILVQEGDRVKQGDILLRLDDTLAKAELRRLNLQYFRLQAIKARYEAESQLQDDLIFPPALIELAENDPDVAEILASQRLTFEASRKSFLGEIAVMEDGARALKARIDGTNIQLENVHAQLRIIKDELGVQDGLLNKGLVNRSQVFALQRAEATLMGETGRLDADIGDATERMARVGEEIRSSQSKFVRAAIDHLQETGSQILDLKERLRATRDIHSRLEIRAPVAGTVLRLRFHTEGGVIEAGKPVIDILPAEEELIIEATVPPKDIDVVSKGQVATIRLTGLNQRTTPLMSGEVIYISADTMRDDTGQRGDQYLVRIKMKQAQLLSENALLSSFQPLPGMPAEVLIQTTERTMLEYLFQPIRDSMARAFRET
jgi:HlyD family type I secretion membrane fusion protein